MRILIVDCNLRYMNPMRNLLPYYMSQAGDDVVFYGPGYSSGEVLEKGLERFVNSQEPFDVEIRTVQAIPAQIIDGISESFASDKLQFYRNTNNYTFRDQDLIAFWSDPSISAICAETRVILLHQFDFQVMSEEFKQYVLEGYDLIVGLNADFWDDHNYSDLNISNAYKHSKCWSDILESASSKVLGLPNFVAPHEFDFNPHIYRKTEWSVVGTTYNNRRIVKEIFANNSINYSTGRTWRYIKLKLLDKARMRPYKKRRNLDCLNHEFHYTLINSKHSYTCGSDLRMPIRKFFEIPAAGCTLVCTPCKGFEELGFIDRVNAVECLPDEVLDVCQYLSEEPEQAQRIADAGRKLVLQKHTADVRAHQLKRAVQLVRTKRYRGSHWSSGDLIFAEYS